jgi:hypothetical protein
MAHITVKNANEGREPVIPAVFGDGKSMALLARVEMWAITR